MKRNTIISICLSFVVINVLYAIPQGTGRQTQNQQQSETDPDIQRQIDAIFPPPAGTFETGSTGTTERTRGAGFVVTPDPNFVPTSSPQTLTINQQNCTCVPYHMCDPTTNTVKSETVNTDAVTGFGVIDIRFDTHDCQEILDVCCLGDSTREESIEPKPVKNVPTQESGCGVRNVGGLDFQLAGAYVSAAA